MTENDRRKFLKTAGAALVGAVGAGALSSLSAEEAAKKRTLKRAELVERLKKLAESETPKDLSSGAMCYVPVSLFERKEEKLCPECKRAMKVGEKDEILNAYNVPLKRIQDQGVDAKLILPDHCPKCGFGLQEGKILLEIKYPDQPKPVRVEPERPSRIILGKASELEMMALFLQGKDRYLAGPGAEAALKDKVERLEELFGIKEKKRAELTEKLKKLGEEEPPKKPEVPGAMCYSPAVIPPEGLNPK